MASEEFIYDSVPYPGYTFPQTHPDRLATMATLYGLKPADPTQCRVLELGCGDGTNLLSFAYALPESEFTGIDLSVNHILDAKAASEHLSLTNVVFQQGDVTELDTSQLGKFDYIIAHGLFSWVPEVVRDRIMTIYADCLTPNGVGYISYNAYPGCHIRQMTNEMMQFHSASITESTERVAHGLALLSFIKDAAEPDGLYKSLLEAEIEQISERSTQNVFHDDFAGINQPFYFSEFASILYQNGLQYLSESEPISMGDGTISPESSKILDRIGTDVIRREQYLDFIKCRRFRSTLVCRSDITIERNPSPSVVSDFRIASQIIPESPDANVFDDSTVKFIGRKGATLAVNHPMTKAALVNLRENWSRSVSFKDLAATASKNLISPVSDEDEDRLKGFLLQMFFGGFVKFHVHNADVFRNVSEFPVASSFARLQLTRGGESVTTMTGTNLKPENDFVRSLILLLDGSRNREMLAESLKEMIEVPKEQKAEFIENLSEMIELNLDKIAEAGMLIA